MLVALVVVPGIAAAWLWTAPAARGRVHALGQLLVGGAAMLVVGGAWPLLVELTPASQRPWISGTSDNRILSLIFEYNGVGRVDGQTGGPGGAGAGGGTMFGGTPGPLRLLNQRSAARPAGCWALRWWAVLAILLASRLRRSDARSGWLLAVGGAFVTTAVLFSVASGIFHPYYVSLLAPFAPRWWARARPSCSRGGRGARVLAPLAVAAGVIVELVVRGDYAGQLTWLPAVLIVVGVVAAIALAAFGDRARAPGGARRGAGRAAAGSRRVGVRHSRPRYERHVPGGRAGVGRDGWLRRPGRRTRFRWPARIGRPGRSPGAAALAVPRRASRAGLPGARSRERRAGRRACSLAPVPVAR